MKQSKDLMVAVLVLALTACGGGDDSGQSSSSGSSPEVATPAPAPEGPTIDPASLAEGTTVAMAQAGREVFDGPGICFTCHTAGGGGGPLAPDLTDETWLNVDGEYSSIVELINTGVPVPKEHPGAMLPKAGMPLTDEQVANVAAYVYTLNR